MTAAFGPGEVEEALQLGPDRPGVGLERLAIEQVALAGTPGRVADHPGPATHQGHRPAAEALQVEQPEDRDEVADMERIRGRIEADVPGDRPPGRQPSREARGRRLEDPAPVELGEESAQIGGSLGRARHRAGRRAVTTRREAADRSITPPMLSCDHSCRPASRGVSATVVRSDADRNPVRGSPSVASSPPSSS